MNKMLDIKEIDDNYYIKLSAFMEVQNKYNWYEEEYHKLVKDYYELYEKLRDAKKQIKDTNKASQNKSSIIKKSLSFIDDHSYNVIENKNDIDWYILRLDDTYDLIDILKGDQDV